MAEQAKKPSAPTASTKLNGNTEKAFNAVRDHMTKVLPGIDPTNAEVTRYAIHKAAKSLSVDGE